MDNNDKVDGNRKGEGGGGERQRGLEGGIHLFRLKGYNIIS